MRPKKGISNQPGKPDGKKKWICLLLPMKISKTFKKLLLLQMMSWKKKPNENLNPTTDNSKISEENQQKLVPTEENNYT